MSKFPKQLFVIPAETWLALEPTEVAETCAAMQTLGIRALPYPEVNVRIAGEASIWWNLDNWKEWKSEPFVLRGLDEGLFQMVFNSKDGTTRLVPKMSGTYLEINNLSLEHCNYQKRMYITPDFKGFKRGHTDAFGPITERERDMIANALIVMLATRNAVKTTVQNKCAKLGIGKGDKRYDYVTTISLPKEREESEHEPNSPGKKKAAHLRRGHIRNQHYGPKNSLIKQKWIEPVFVNADEDWVSKRERYNVSL